MSQPKNSTIQNNAQPLGQTVAVAFHDNTADGAYLLSVNKDAPSKDALTLAAELSDGIKLLSDRLHASLNEGELVFCDEVSVLGFLAETVSALVYSVSRSQADQGGAQ